ncbi:MAG: CARDB domain-containing protein [Chloroflexota bacterium]
MKTKLSRFVALSLLIALVLATFPSPVYAARVVNSITPNVILNDVVNVITVTGTEFDATAAVLLDGSALSTNFLNAQTLTATVPAGVSAGDHTITVSMTGDPVTGSLVLTVVAPTPTPPPTATNVPLPFVRPQFVVKSSKTNGSVSNNSEFKLNVVIENAGTAAAYSVQAVFASADLVPLKNGGVAVVNNVSAGEQENIAQNFLVTGSTYGKSVIAVDVTVTYYDDEGVTYSDKFILSIPTSGGGGSGIVYPTSTPTGLKSSQLVITSYAVSIDPLQPGEQFTLTATVHNVGNVRAQNITMIVGGGSSGTSGGETPQPGGVSGGSGEFTNFAPVGASNVQSLGDLAAGNMIQARQNLIVNVSTNPGAYPMKITFSYLNDKNETINDEQVITLLVYSLPNVDVSFYRPPDPFFVGQPGALPIQVVNIGKRSAVLGTMKLTTGAGTIENGSGLIGSIDTGGYFTLDSMLIPEQSGTVTMDVTIEYTDDFNQQRTMTRTLEVEVMEGMIEEPIIDPSTGGGEGFPVPSEETALQKVWRFILGVFGLDSAPPSGGEEILPEFEEPAPQIKPGSGKG